jgi:hypothetical protein
MSKLLRTTAPEGAETHYPRQWDPKTIALTCLLALSLAECFRSEIAVRIGALAAVVVLGAILFIPLRNIALTLAGLAWLKVSREGIAYRYGNTAASFAWKDIQGFSTVSLPPAGKQRAVSIAVNGAKTAILLPDNYNWLPSELADYLNRLRERYAEPGPAAHKIYEK